MPASTAHSKSLVFISRLLVGAVVGLIFVGAMVTSKGAGMAVPDWPLSFGSLNPPKWWENEGVFWEHGHRLFASMIGLVVIALLVAMYRVPQGKHLRALGWIALVGVILQGVLGGIRVLLGTAGHETEALLVAIGHACLAQSFFCLTLGILVMIHGVRFVDREQTLLPGQFRLGAAIVGALLFQLVVGAIIRHFKAGLAIPDFPLSFGRWVPPLETAPVILAFIHRSWAFVIVGLIFWLAARVLFEPGSGRTSRRLVWVILTAVMVQVALGATVIWTQKLSIPTSLHVLNGALLLGSVFVFTLRAWLAGRVFAETARQPNQPVGVA